MKKPVLFFTIFFISNILFAQDIEETLGEIRAKYKFTNDNLKYYTKKVTLADEKKYTSYFDSAGERVLFTVDVLKNGIKQSISFYSKWGSLYFMFREADLEEQSLKIQERIYFSDSSVIQYLTKEKPIYDPTEFSKIQNVNTYFDQTLFDETNNRYLRHLTGSFNYKIFDNETDSFSAIKQIRAEYSKIVSDKNKMRNLSVYYQAPIEFSYYNTTITLFYNSKNEICLITDQWNDEGISGTDEYYFKDGKCFFVFKSSQSYS